MHTLDERRILRYSLEYHYMQMVCNVSFAPSLLCPTSQHMNELEALHQVFLVSNDLVAAVIARNALLCHGRREQTKQTKQS
jgi:hypothetical protein